MGGAVLFEERVTGRTKISDTGYNVNMSQVENDLYFGIDFKVAGTTLEGLEALIMDLRFFVITDCFFQGEIAASLKYLFDGIRSPPLSCQFVDAVLGYNIHEDHHLVSGLKLIFAFTFPIMIAFLSHLGSSHVCARKLHEVCDVGNHLFVVLMDVNGFHVSVLWEQPK